MTCRASEKNFFQEVRKLRKITIVSSRKLNEDRKKVFAGTPTSFWASNSVKTNQILLLTKLPFIYFFHQAQRLHYAHYTSSYTVSR